VTPLTQEVRFGPYRLDLVAPGHSYGARGRAAEGRAPIEAAHACFIGVRTSVAEIVGARRLLGDDRGWPGQSLPNPYRLVFRRLGGCPSIHDRVDEGHPTHGGSVTTDGRSRTPLPAERAFVVHFRADADPAAGPLTGRIARRPHEVIREVS
jgi:hypothetical protein